MPFAYSLFPSETWNHHPDREAAKVEGINAHRALAAIGQAAHDTYLRGVETANTSTGTKPVRMHHRPASAMNPMKAPTAGNAFRASLNQHHRSPIAAARAGVPSARYPTVAAVSRPEFVPAMGSPMAYRSRPRTAPAIGARPQSAPPLLAVGIGGYGNYHNPSPQRAKVAAPAEHRMLQLLQELHAHSRAGIPQPKLPVHSHGERIPSAHRGLSLAAIRALRRFYGAHGMLDRPLAEVIEPPGGWEGTVGYGAEKAGARRGRRSFGATSPSYSGVSGPGASSLSSLTRHTGLSLVESLVLMAEQMEPDLHPTGAVSRTCLALAGGAVIAARTNAGNKVRGLVGSATTLVSYRGGAGSDAGGNEGGGADMSRDTISSPPIRLGDVLLAVEKLGTQLEEQDADDDDHHKTRYYWIDLFALSQPLCLGRYSPGHYEPRSAARTARSEPVGQSVAQAAMAVEEAFVYQHDGRYGEQVSHQLRYQEQQQQLWHTQRQGALQFSYGPMTTRRQLEFAIAERRTMLPRAVSPEGQAIAEISEDPPGSCVVRAFPRGSDLDTRLGMLEL